METWKDIEGYQGRYKVSNQGAVMSICRDLAGRQLTPEINAGGYLRVFLRDDTGSRKKYSVHRLVAQAFIENSDGKPDVNHIDGDKKNNCQENLEWATKLENFKHAVSTGLMTTVGTAGPSVNRKLTSEQADQVRELYASGGLRIVDLAAKFGLSRSSVQRILTDPAYYKAI